MKVVEDLPDWDFELDEVSANVYSVKAVHKLGCSLELNRIDPEKLMKQAERDAKKMELEIQKKLTE